LEFKEGKVCKSLDFSKTEKSRSRSRFQFQNFSHFAVDFLWIYIFFCLADQLDICHGWATNRLKMLPFEQNCWNNTFETILYVLITLWWFYCEKIIMFRLFLQIFFWSNFLSVGFFALFHLFFPQKLINHTFDRWIFQFLLKIITKDV
jgi:hypothetical protein